MGVYANALGLGVAYDSNFLVKQDERIRAFSTAGLKLIFTTHYWWPLMADRLYRPITTLSFLFNYAVLGNGQGAAGYHLVNAFLHSANVVLAFALALRVLQKPLPAFLAAALWAVHPINAETVANIAGRADLLATMALLASLLLYIRISSPARTSWFAVAALFAAALLGVFSKETGAVLIGVMALWDIAFARKSRWTPARVAAYGVAAASLAIYWLARARVFASVPWPEEIFVVNPLRGAGFWTARLTAVKIIAYDLWLMVCPVRLASDRQYNEIPLFHAGDLYGWLGLAVVTALLAVVLARARRDPVIFWATGFLAIALLPASNLVILIGSIMAERFLYLPSLGFAIAMAALLFRLESKRAAPAILGIAILLFAGRTLARNPVWNDDVTLAAADARAAPGNFHPHTAMAAALFQQGGTRNLDDALREQEAGWRILQDLPPDRMFVPGPADLGMYYRLKGDSVGGPATPEGRAWYLKSLDVLLRAREASQAARTAFDSAQLAHGKPLTKRPAYGRLYFVLATVYAGLGRYPESIENYRYYRALDPDLPAPYTDLTNGYIAGGDWASATVTVLQKGFAFGFDSQTLAAANNFYARIPGGECAIRPGSVRVLNTDCPRVHEDSCRALADLQQVFIAGREPDRARRFQDTARQYGCPVQPPRPML
jgi:tetratricopeptide (TPR) repeat protein